MTRFAGLHRLLTGVAEAPLLLRSQTIRSALGRNENPAGETAGRFRRNRNMLAEHAPAGNKSKGGPGLFKAPKEKALTSLDGLEMWLRRGATEVFTVTVMVTPDLATRLLERNSDNRPIRQKGDNRSVEAYARAMQRGEWKLNGEAIIVSSDGSLNDGQHRLAAVTCAGMAVPMLLTFGVERETRHTVDQGAARSPGQILAMRGEQNYNTLAHAVQFVWAYEGQKVFSYRPSTDQLIETLDRNPGLRDAVYRTAKLAVEFRISAGYVAGAYYVCRRINSLLADQLLEQTITGLGLTEQGSPVFKLRKRYLGHVTRQTDLIPATEQAALFIKAFNALLSRRNVRVLLWRQNGPTAEDFPVAGA